MFERNPITTKHTDSYKAFSQNGYIPNSVLTNLTRNQFAGRSIFEALATVNHQLARSSFSTETKTRLCGGGPTINNDGGCVSTPILDEQIYYSDREE